MILPQRRKLPHQLPDWVKPGSSFFLTICCAERHVNQLCRDDVARILFEAVEFRQNALRWYVHLLLLMPDHLHAIVGFPAQERMAVVVSNFKEMTAKKADVCWQSGFFDHRLRSNESYDEKAAYIRANPVRAGLVENAAKWPWVWEAKINGGPGGPALPYA